MVVSSGTFGEGSLSFRLKEGSGSSNGYTDSDIYTLKISNGYLEPFPPAPTPIAAPDVACRVRVAQKTREIQNTGATLLVRCLDRALKHLRLGTAEAPAQKACSLKPGDPKSLSQKLSLLLQVAKTKVQNKCPTQFGDKELEALLGKVRCEIEERVGAIDHEAAETIHHMNPTLTLQDVLTEFPCLKSSTN